MKVAATILGYTLGGLYRCQCNTPECPMQYLATKKGVEEDKYGLCPQCEANVMALESLLKL